MKTIPAYLCALIATTAFASAQGSLTPPGGAPGPVMKTLDQIEPRIDIQNAPVSAVSTADPNYHYIINEPGSYFLTANLAVTKTNGIKINSENVSLDLSGFEITRGSGTGGTGIEIVHTAHGASLSDGSVAGFLYGVNLLFSGYYARGCHYRNLSVSACTDRGIMVGEGGVAESCTVNSTSGTYGMWSSASATFRNCTVSRSTVTYGISVGQGGTITGCTASNNTTPRGIYLSDGSNASNCTAYKNTSTTGSSSGIEADSGCTVVGCASFDNTSTATASYATGTGFDIGSGSIIRGCTARNNRGDGIRVLSGGVVIDNVCTGNGNSGDGAGIHATGIAARIEGNHVYNNDRGVDVDSNGNVIVRNTATSNMVNFDIAINNVFGAIVDRIAPASAAVSGNSAASSAGTTDPWANFAH